MSDTQPRKTDVQKLQRAIVDGLEDVKGQDIVVFNTEHLSPLFERVIIASGTSNRQTKALASSVSDAVREAGFPKPRVEGAENGEWIIVDCGAAVAHVMQPSIRQYYHLEEIWGGKKVNLKLGTTAQPAAKPASKTADTPAPAKTGVTRTAKAKPAVAQTAVAKAPAKAAPKAASKVAAKTVAKAAGTPTAPSKGAVAPATPVKKAARKTASAAPAFKLQKLVVGQPAVKKAAAKAPARKVAPRKKAG